MEVNVVFAYSIMKHDCHALLEKKTIVTKAASLVFRVQLVHVEAEMNEGE